MSEINKIRRKLIGESNVGAAIRRLRAVLAENPFVVSGVLRQRLENLESDYQRMCDFMLHGYRDDQREEVYRSLLRRMADLLGDFELAELQATNATFGTAAKNHPDLTDDYDTVRQMLEGYVQNLAMLSLEPEEQAESRLQTLHDEHLKQLDTLFNGLLSSRQWSSGKKSFYTELLLSPTIDNGDAALLISAVMLSAMAVADIAKLEMLFEVYRRATDEIRRQRALVGLAFALPDKDFNKIFPEYDPLVEQLCADEPTRRELLELQKQIFLCMDADRDHETIRRDIMPTIIKNQNIRITRFGIEEVEEDALQDILNPDADDEKMEELEQTIQRMMDMQRSGSDIYFGGFSQMKRFSFFYTTSNWLMPFNVEHPGLRQVAEKLKNSRFLQLLLDRGPFCDSDKYSFALAMSSVLDRLPENMRELLNNEDALGPTMEEVETRSAAYIRRMYLQDLYRFFRLFPQKNDFQSPFDYEKSPEFFFFTNPIFSQSALATQAISLERFLLKKKQYDALMRVLHNFDSDSPEQQMIEASLALRRGNYRDAQQLFARVLEKMPDDERAMHGMARASFNCGDYATATQYYEKLLSLNPENAPYDLNACIAKIHNGQAEEAVQRLYKHYYERPDDKNVCRALAWGLLVQGSLEQADKLYDSLVSDAENTAADCLNAGYCKWFGNDVEAAVGLFRRYLRLLGKQAQNHALVNDFKSDAELLQAHGIGRTEMLLMDDLVRREV